MTIDVFLPPRGRHGRSNREVRLKHGMGCKHFKNCFVCPLADCTFSNPISWKCLTPVWVYTDGQNYYSTLEEMRGNGDIDRR